MENFRRTIKHRIIWLISLNALALVFIISVGLYSSKGSGGHVSEFIRGFQAGIFMVLQAYLLFLTVWYALSLRNEERLNKLKIAENDERARLIRDKIGGVGFNFSLAAIAAGAVAAGFLNEIVFFTLMAVTIFMALVKAALKFHYNTKY